MHSLSYIDFLLAHWLIMKGHINRLKLIHKNKYTDNKHTEVDAN